MLIISKLRTMLTIFLINTRSAPETAIVAQCGIIILSTMLSLTSKYSRRQEIGLMCKGEKFK
uniref:Uncharacterized protein n=1 Tax=Romanomermis culicivorax TaxID=13658 RepID=A0A915JLR3_ROMCU